jgi:hypothetical protein
MKKTDKKKLPKVTIKRDESCEMMEVWVDEDEYMTGNYWDFSTEDWLDLLRKLDVKVVEKKYKFKY